MSLIRKTSITQSPRIQKDAMWRRGLTFAPPIPKALHAERDGYFTRMLFAAPVVSYLLGQFTSQIISSRCCMSHAISRRGFVQITSGLAVGSVFSGLTRGLHAADSPAWGGWPIGIQSY